MDDPLAGCGLPQAWRGQRQWRILDTAFGSGLKFLAAWRAWREDPQRPPMLHVAACAAHPVAAGQLLADVASFPALQPLASELAQRWWGLVPGVHRLAFDDGRVLLTIGIGDARDFLLQQGFAADTVLVDDLDLRTLKAVTHLSRRGTRLAARAATPSRLPDLRQCGFRVEEREGVLAGVFDPAWEPRGGSQAIELAPGAAIVVGGGLAGAATASSLARRGWRVQVLDSANEPASGASALPAGLLAPHASPDDNLLSRLSRAGVRMTLRECATRLREGQDWSPSGALERRAPRAAADLGPEGEPWQQWRDDGLWHRAAAWVKPAALVRAWLRQPGVEWIGGAQATALENLGPGWRVASHDGRRWEADQVVVAAALGSASLLPKPVRLHAVRGQVSWDLHADSGFVPAGSPVNGNGHFLPHVPLADGPAWLGGSTYVRGDLGVEPREDEQRANLERLRAIVPGVAAQLQPRFDAGLVRAWCGVRCASADRRPLVGMVAPGLWVSTAMGSRGLTFAHLAAESIAARLHGEPAPLPARLAQALDVGRRLG